MEFGCCKVVICIVYFALDNPVNLCQPLTTSKRLQTLCGRAFCQPDNLKVIFLSIFVFYGFENFGRLKPLGMYDSYLIFAAENIIN